MNNIRIFISHRQSDSERAEQWARLLGNSSVECYIDTLDPNPQNLQGREVSKYLHEQLRACSHLLVVFTLNTRGSMWVPFEIGIATERDIGIAIDLPISIENLPEYLLEWPILQQQSHYNAFVSEVQKAPITRSVTKSLGHRYSDQFHKNLKAKITNL